MRTELAIGAMIAAVVVMGCREDECKSRPAEAQIAVDLGGLSNVAKTEVALVVNGNAPLVRDFNVPAPKFVFEFGSLDVPPRTLLVEATAYNAGGNVVGFGSLDTTFTSDGCNFFTVPVKPAAVGDAAVDTGRDMGVADMPVADAPNGDSMTDGPKPDVPGPDATTPPWTAMQSNTTEGLSSVWGFNENDVFVVGNGGLILHFDGTTWAKQTSGTTSDLYTVWGSSPTNVYAVGMTTPVNKQTVLRYNGSAWNFVTDTGSTNHSRGVHGCGPNDVWVGDASGWVLHYDGATWSSQKAGTSTAFIALWCGTSSDVWAAGYDGAISRYNGSAWVQQTSPTSGAGIFYGLWGSGQSDIYATTGGALFHFDGQAWSKLSVPSTGTYAVHGTGATDVFVVGAAGSVLHFDGTQWKTESSGTTEYLYSVWVAPSGTVYAVGKTGTILVRK